VLLTETVATRLLSQKCVCSASDPAGELTVLPRPSGFYPPNLVKLGLIIPPLLKLPLPSAAIKNIFKQMHTLKYTMRIDLMLPQPE